MLLKVAFNPINLNQTINKRLLISYLTCVLSQYVHFCTILTLGRSINLYMQDFDRNKHMIFCMAIYPCMNIQDLAKSLMTLVLQSIPVVANPFLFAIRILMVMEYGVLPHARQSRFGSEEMLEDYAVSVQLQRRVI